MFVPVQQAWMTVIRIRKKWTAEPRMTAVLHSPWILKSQILKPSPTGEPVIPRRTAMPPNQH